MEASLSVCRVGLLETPPLDVYSQMALDEVLLGGPPGADFEAVLRFYHWSSQAVTFGYFQKFEEVRQGIPGDIPIARRPTGGGIVIHDVDLTFSLVFPWVHFTPQAIYERIHRGVQAGLQNLGVSTAIWECLSNPPSAQRCFARPSHLDLVHSGQKVLGGALRKRGAWGLYQGSLRWGRSMRSDPAFQRAIAQGLGRAWGNGECVLSSAELDSLWMQSARKLADEKYRSKEWNQKR